MLGEENSRETQFLLRAANMSLLIPPHVYVIYQHDQDEDEAGGWQRLAYFVVASSNVLVGLPALSDDLFEALDALGGVDLLFLSERTYGSPAAYEEAFGCKVLRRADATTDLLLIEQPGKRRHYLHYSGAGGVIFASDYLASDEGELAAAAAYPLAEDEVASLSAHLLEYDFAAVLTERVRGELITAGGRAAVARLTEEAQASS